MYTLKSTYIFQNVQLFGNVQKIPLFRFCTVSKVHTYFIMHIYYVMYKKYLHLDFIQFEKYIHKSECTNISFMYILYCTHVPPTHCQGGWVSTSPSHTLFPFSLNLPTPYIFKFQFFPLPTKPVSYSKQRLGFKGKYLTYLIEAMELEFQLFKFPYIS